MAKVSIEGAVQARFSAIVNQMGLTDLRRVHYVSEIGTLRIGVGRDVNGRLRGIFWWAYPELDQDGKTFQYGNTWQGNEGDTYEQAHDEIKDFAENFAREMLSGRVSK